VTVDRIAVQVVLTVCCICFHMEEVLLPVPFQAVLMTCLIEEDTLEMPLWIWLMPCVTTCPICCQLCVVAVCTWVQAVFTAVVTCVAAVEVLVAICVQALVYAVCTAVMEF
jgi:hypothetical protein